MTADIKLLPERFDCTNGNTPWCQGCYTMTPDEYGDYVQWEDYERIAAAKDAEIERLRAEVSAVKESLSTDLRATRSERGRAMEACQLISGHLATAEGRAERLAEALHKLEDSCEDSDGAQYGTLATSFVRGICKDALRDHDQEEGK